MKRIFYNANDHLYIDYEATLTMASQLGISREGLDSIIQSKQNRIGPKIGRRLFSIN